MDLQERLLRRQRPRRQPVGQRWGQTGSLVLLPPCVSDARAW